MYANDASEIFWIILIMSVACQSAAFINVFFFTLYESICSIFLIKFRKIIYTFIKIIEIALLVEEIGTGKDINGYYFINIEFER